MNRITWIDWQTDRIAHIQVKHQVSPREVEEVCFGQPVILRGKGKQIYQVLGQTQAGCYLFIVVRFLGESRVRVITARDMDQAERRWYTRR
jgi:hypothetical protein